MTQLDLAKPRKRRSYVRPSLLALTACFAASALTATAAHAQSVDPAQIEALQEQIKQLQAEIDGLVANQVKQSKKISAIAPAKGAVIVSSPGKGQLKIGAVTVTLGGYLEADGIYRSKAMQSDLNSALSGVPFNGGTTSGLSPNALASRQSEFRETARATRLSVGLKANPDAYTALSGYVEGDFLGTGGGTGNTKQTNSFSPRLRQAWAGYERADYGLHVFGGQTYSFATSETVGMSPGKEAALGWIDSATTAGFVNVRQAGLRVFKDFDKKYFVGISFENPTLVPVGSATGATATFAGAQTLGTTASLTGSSVAVTGGAGTVTAAGSTPVGATVSDDVAPDIILKGAADTSFGHYELFGIGRFLRTRESVAAASAGHSTMKTATGIGASAFDSIIPGRLDIQGNFIYGTGVARYSAAQLGDVTYDKAGGLKLLTSVVSQIGATVHVLPTLDVWGLGGVELIHSGGNGTGYGNGVADTSGCYTVGGTAAVTTCSTEIKQVDELSAGSWWSFYKGAAGTFQTGLQYAYLRDIAFQGSKGGAPHASDNMLFLSLRYLPFK